VTPVSAVLAPVFAALVAAAALGVTGLVATAAGLLAAVGAARFMTVRLGGLTGDVFGAVVEVAELAVLLVVIAWTGVRS
jgi:adenosylcobinamide-GDP ribazoletransferase